MVAHARARRLAERVKEIVASSLEFDVLDPRLGFVTVTDVRVTPDLREATVFYTVLGDESEQAATAVALESAKGILRTEVGRQTGIKHTPSLAFVIDALPDTSRHIDDLLRQAAAADAEVHARASGASYAGDADPYRHDDADEESETVGGDDSR